jgi:HK97 family phage prohead protease
MTMIRLTATDTFILAEDGESPRTISGIAVPWGVEATVSDGTRVRFERGSLPISGKKPKLLKYHDSTQPVGVVTGRVDSEKGMVFTARISATSEGNDMLELIKDEAVDAVSVGVDVIDARYDDDGTMVIAKADWVELSLVTQPAFKGATITDVAATEPQREESQPMSDKVEATAAKVTEAPAPAPTMLFAEPKAPFKLPSAAEYMAKFAVGGAEFAEFNARIKATAPNVITSDTPGLLPEPIVAPVYDSLNPIRPFVTAIGARAMPESGTTFRRPVITVRPTVTQQPTGQLTQLNGSDVQVSNNNVSKLTFGTYVNISEQSIDFTDPNSLAIVLNQLAIAYGEATDNYAVDTCHAAITQTATVTDTAVGADWVAAIYEGARQISLNSNYLPTHLFLTPGSWAALASSVDDAGRPVFPFVGAPNLSGQNAAGAAAATTWNGNPLGLVLVVDKNAPGSFMGHAAGPAAGFEFYEQQKGAISIDTPATLGRTIAFRGYAASFMADATKFVKFV